MQRRARLAAPGLMGLLAAVLLGAAAPEAPRVVIDASGDGQGHPLRGPGPIALGPKGEIYVAGFVSHNVFRVAPDGTTTMIIGPDGDHQGAELSKPRALAVDAKGTVYVVGTGSHNVFAVDPDGTVRLLLAYDTPGYKLRRPMAVTTDRQGRVYVACHSSHNVLRVSPDGKIDTILDTRGDGEHAFRRGNGIAVDADGDVYVLGARSRNVFRITPAGEIAQVLSADGAGPGHELVFPSDILVDEQHNVYIAGNNSGNVLRIDPAGKVTEVVGRSTAGLTLSGVSRIARAPDGTLYAAGMPQQGVWRTKPGGGIEQVIAEGAVAGDVRLEGVRNVVLDGKGHLLVAGARSHNVIALDVPPPGPAPEPSAAAEGGAALSPAARPDEGRGKSAPGLVP